MLFRRVALGSLKTKNEFLLEYNVTFHQDNIVVKKVVFGKPQRIDVVRRRVIIIYDVLYGDSAIRVANLFLDEFPLVSDHKNNLLDPAIRNSV
jgi:pyrimidine operon attenuation protein/uracil phosphoribosyltransferase